MEFKVVSKQLPEYLRVDFTGNYAFTEMLSVLVDIKAAADEARSSRLLVDSRELVGTIGESHKFFIGSRIAELFGPLLKIALIMRPGTVTKLGEMVASNRGAKLHVTDSESDAIGWLLR